MNVDYNMLMVSSSSSRRWGAGTGAAVGGAGAASTTATNSVGFSYGNFVAAAGQQGGAGGAVAGGAGTGISWAVQVYSVLLELEVVGLLLVISQEGLLQELD